MAGARLKIGVCPTKFNGFWILLKKLAKFNIITIMRNSIESARSRSLGDSPPF
jgi:hypothetical protein